MTSRIRAVFVFVQDRSVRPSPPMQMGPSREDSVALGRARKRPIRVSELL
jgi:hypothetical protein